ncbi:hypothetical protein K2V74_05995 [Mammaliicoccus sciuri]|uniref:hypothetical protein n=1 Tax=Mammaliicoccus sciuri TaxID=1296 RepID=UPI001E56A8DB|nr:hypothetical protein [Mammaliicoccus sciuri]MCD8873884.1 hypothetical protein [Mammaliicoccus sciuri]
MQKILCRALEDRLEWAFQAKEDFLNQFGEFENDKNIKKNNKVVISVYGSSQAGKTTMILSLLGIKKQYFEEFNKVLRGGRDLGNSATVTATIFKVINGSNYKLKIPRMKEMEINNLDDLEQELKSIRERVENSSFIDVEPLVIGIPKNKFDTNFLKGFDNIEIIDLPGIESAEKKETEHVNRCIRYWIPNSHKTIIVGRATDLTFFRDISNSYLSDWFEEKESTIVVLTRAFTPDSIKSQIWDNDLEVIEHYRNSLEIELKEQKGKILNDIFPIEIGDSYKILGKELQIISDSIFNKLRSNISNTDFHKVSFNHLKDFYKQILKKETDEIRRIEMKKANLENNFKKRKSYYEKSIQNLEKKYSLYQTYYDDLNFLKNEIQKIDKKYNNMKIELNTIERTIKKSQKPYSKYKLHGILSNELIKINNFLQNYIDEINTLIVDYNSNYVIDADISLYIRKSDSRINVLFTKKRYEEYGKQLFRSLKNEMNLKLDEINTLVNNVLNSIEESISNVSKKINRIQRNIDRNKNDLLDLMGDHKLRKEKYSELLKETKYQFAKDVEEAKNYRLYFIKHFKIRKNYLTELLNTENILIGQYAQVSLLFLERDAKLIINSMEVS